MHHFFVDPSRITEDKVKMEGSDVNHMKNVLRMNVGEELLISDGHGADYICRISNITQKEIEAEIIRKEKEGTELSVQIYLFQGVPKSDKMEWIIQKAVELGAYQIVPMATHRCIVKLDEKKEAAKRKRWQSIAESAAKQSRRGVIPQIHPVVDFKQAVKMAEDFSCKWIPYENFKDMESAKKILEQIHPGDKIAVYIGPEGGFESWEVDYAIEHGITPVSLGRRILRTETAGLMLLSVLMFQSELNHV